MPGRGLPVGMTLGGETGVLPVSRSIRALESADGEVVVPMVGRCREGRVNRLRGIDRRLERKKIDNACGDCSRGN